MLWWLCDLRFFLCALCAELLLFRVIPRSGYFCKSAFILTPDSWLLTPSN